MNRYLGLPVDRSARTTMMALARVAFALAASLVGAADVVTYDNATKEVATMEAF